MVGHSEEVGSGYANADGERYLVLSVANRPPSANATNAKSDAMGMTLNSWYRASTDINPPTM